MNRDLDFQHIKLSDFVRISDTDVTYAGLVTDGLCNDCGKKIKGRSFRCGNCKLIVNRERSRLFKASKHNKKQCLDCGMEIARCRRCAVCKEKHVKQRVKEVYENDLKASKFYVPPKESQNQVLIQGYTKPL